MNDNKAGAAYHGAGECPRSCCWTPYGCGRKWRCDHHRAAAARQAEKDTETDLIQDMERRFSLAAKRRAWA